MATESLSCCDDSRVVNKRGRPRGASTTRQALIDAARRHLDAGDLTHVSSRDLAREVGVSHTLVNYHFGSRDALIALAITSRVAPHEVIALARDQAGRIQTPRLVQGLVAAWEDPAIGGRLVDAARRYAASDEASEAIAQYLQNAVFAPLVSDFGVARARGMAMTIVGFLYGRYVLRMPLLASLTKDEAVRHLLSALR